MFSKVNYKVDYISTNSSKLWTNIIYLHPNENDNVKGFHYLVNRFIHECPVIPDGNLVVIGCGFINI